MTIDEIAEEIDQLEADQLVGSHRWRYLSLQLRIANLRALKEMSNRLGDFLRESRPGTADDAR